MFDFGHQRKQNSINELIVKPRRSVKPAPVRWRFDWRNPDMDVLRRPWVEVLKGVFEKREMICDPEESQAIARQSLKECPDREFPRWRDDPSYFWGKNAKRRIR